MSASPVSDLIKQAKTAFENEDFIKSAQLYADSAEYYTAANDLLSAAEMDNNRSVALLKAGRPQEALQAALGTDSIFAAAGDLHRQALALGNQAAAYEGLKQYERALTLYQDCAEKLKETGDQEMRHFVLQSISALQLRRGKQLDAMVTMDNALDQKPHLNLVDRFLKKLIHLVYSLLRR